MNDTIQEAQTDEFVRSCSIPEEYIEVVNNLKYSMVSGFPRLLLPLKFTQEVCDLVHNLGHFGVKRTLNTIARQYFWPGMRKQINDTVRACKSCQINKIVKPQRRVLQAFPRTDRFRTVHVDIVGPLPISSKGKQYIFTMVDRFTRWMEAVPMRNISAENCATVFFNTWVTRFGCPDYLISDQGAQFESILFKEMLSHLGITRCRTTSYHASANGLIERRHSTMKNMLRCMINYVNDWETLLPKVMMAMRNATLDSGISPFLATYGTESAMPISLINSPSLVLNDQDKVPECNSEFVQDLISNLTIVRSYLLTTDTTLSGDKDKEGQVRDYPYDYIWLKDPIMKSSLAAKYLGPYEIIEVDYPNITILKDGKHVKVSVDRCRPAIRMLSNEALVERNYIPDNERVLDERYYVPRDRVPSENDLVNVPIIPQLNIRDRLAYDLRDHRSGYGRNIQPPDRFY
jgi:cleavage and polyadenylation specificity factor subunit 1